MHSARVSCTLTLFMVVRNYTAELLSFYDYHTYKEFQDLIHETQVISRWLIGVSSVILIAVIVDLVLTVVTDIFNITFYLQLTIGIIVSFVKQILNYIVANYIHFFNSQELVFIIVAMLGFIGSGIVFGALASDWSPYGLSEICDLKIFKLIVADDDDPCDSVALTTTIYIIGISKLHF